MIILDTNVVSEPLRPRCDLVVQAWLGRQPAETLYLTATSLSELLLGAEILPASKRKDSLKAALKSSLARLFGARILPFDQTAAAMYASLVGRARTMGRLIAVPDGQIAAVAAVHGYAVATRDTGPFVAAGVKVINPWQE